MRRLSVVLCAVVLLAVLALTAGCSGGEVTTTSTAVATTSSTGTTLASTTSSPTTTAGTVTTASSTTAATTTTTNADSAGWQKVVELSGSGTGEKTSELFDLSGAPARISYKVETDTVWTMAAFVEPEGWDIKTQGGFPDVWESEKKEGSETLEQEAGSHFLYVTAANCDWTVWVEEEK